MATDFSVIARRQLPVHSTLTLRALMSGAVGAMGVNAQRALTWRIRNYWGARDVAFTSGGTAALSLAMRAALRGDDALIALPAYGCYDLATAAEGAGARVVLYDLEPHSLAPDPESLERALKLGPRALVLVHLFGLPVDIMSLAARAAGQGVVIIEDAAQAIGALLGGRPAGSFGSVSILSFGRGKGLTGGSGGALLANDDTGSRILEHARLSLAGTRAGWSDLARAAAQWTVGRPALYSLPAALPFLRLGQTVYHPPQSPRVLSRAAAGMIFRNWKSALEAAARRRATATRLIAAARTNSAWRTLPLTSEGVASYLRLPLLANGDARAVVLSRSAAKLGIMQGYPMPIVKLPGFAHRCINGNERFPGAELLAERLFTLPTHDLLNDRDVLALQHWLSDTGAEKPGRQREALAGRRA